MNKQNLLENEQALFKNIQNDIHNLGKFETFFDDLTVLVKVLTEQLAYLRTHDTKFFDVKEFIQKLAILFDSLLNECSKNQREYHRIISVGIDLLDYIHSTSAPVYNGTTQWIARNILKCYTNKYRLDKLNDTLLKHLYFPSLYLTQMFFWGDALGQDYESIASYKKNTSYRPFKIYLEEDIIKIETNKKETIKELLKNNPKLLLLHILHDNSFCVDSSALYESSQIYKLWKQPIFCFCCFINTIKEDAEGEFYDQSMLSQHGPQDTNSEDEYTEKNVYWDDEIGFHTL